MAILDTTRLAQGDPRSLKDAPYQRTAITASMHHNDPAVAQGGGRAPEVKAKGLR